jgi:hypothetical protein
MIRVLVVDDSATMRGLITATLQRDPEIKVIGQACDPLEARQAIKDLNPDAEYERPGFSRKNHAAAADAGDHGFDADA